MIGSSARFARLPDFSVLGMCEGTVAKPCGKGKNYFIVQCNINP